MKLTRTVIAILLASTLALAAAMAEEYRMPSHGALSEKLDWYLQSVQDTQGLMEVVLAGNDLLDKLSRTAQMCNAYRDHFAGVSFYDGVNGRQSRIYINYQTCCTQTFGPKILQFLPQAVSELGALGGLGSATPFMEAVTNLADETISQVALDPLMEDLAEMGRIADRNLDQMACLPLAGSMAVLLER
jgi:hypothetical protein